eukprot:scaffold293835_cov23-Tisochrysis_lutea.AAC.4
MRRRLRSSPAQSRVSRVASKGSRWSTSAPASPCGLILSAGLLQTTRLRSAGRPGGAPSCASASRLSLLCGSQSSCKATHPSSPESELRLLCERSSRTRWRRGARGGSWHSRLWARLSLLSCAPTSASWPPPPREESWLNARLSS